MNTVYYAAKLAGGIYLLSTRLLLYRLPDLLSQEARGGRSPLAHFFSISLIRSVITFFAKIWRIPQSVSFYVTVNVTRPTEQRLSAERSTQSGVLQVNRFHHDSHPASSLLHINKG